MPFSTDTHFDTPPHSRTDGDAVQLCLTAVCREAVPAVYASENRITTSKGSNQLSATMRLNPFDVHPISADSFLPQVPLRGTQRLSMIGRFHRPKKEKVQYLRIKQ